MLELLLVPAKIAEVLTAYNRRRAPGHPPSQVSTRRPRFRRGCAARPHVPPGGPACGYAGPRAACQSAMRRATAGLVAAARRAGQRVASTEAAAVTATSTAMLVQGTGKPMSAALISGSFLNSR